MIVKIEKKDKLNNCIGYYYYEADEIEYWSTNMKEAQSYNYTEVDWLIGENHEKREELFTTMLFLYDDNKRNLRKIITTRNCYILNNNGKTIDKLLA